VKSFGLATQMNSQPEDLLRGKQVVFLVGAPRSGTTWLQLLLSRSPSIVTAQETHLFNGYLRSMVDQWDRDRVTRALVGVTLVLDDEEHRVLLRRASEFVLAKIARGKPSATVVLDKTPDHVNCARGILEAWPDAHFIHIVRDPRSVVASMRVASKSWARQWFSSRISKNCQRWVRDVSNGRQIRSATPRYQEVTYEELLADGPRTLMRILLGLGVLEGLDDCQRFVDECNIRNLQAGHLAGAPFDVTKMGKESFRIGTSDSWRTELTAWDVALVERLAGPLMSELGYKLATRNKGLSALVDFGWFARGIAKAAKHRLQRFAEQS
jgi:hypothetical protein